MSTIVNAPAVVGVVDDRHYLTRIRRWMRYRRELAGFVIDTLCILSSERATGSLKFNFTQGCAASAEFEESVNTKDILGELAGADERDQVIEEGTIISAESINRAAEKRRDDLRRVGAGVDYLVRYLRDNPCLDCGNSDLDVLEFDHVRGVKVGNVSSMAYGGNPLGDIIKEIEKCEVRCANCHSKRHAIVRRNDASRAGYKDHFFSMH